MPYKYLPDQLDADAVNVLIAIIGGGVPLSDTVDAAYHVGGFALAKIVPETPKVGAASLSDKEQVELLIRLRNHYAGEPFLVAAVEIPWALVWMVVQQIINKYLQG
jgi:hypothetical protein